MLNATEYNISTNLKKYNHMIRVLIGDDHFLVRKGIKELLLDHYPSISFDEAEDTSTLIEKALASEWDLIISDIDMPGEGGLYALTEIRHRYPSLPILMLSIHSEHQYALRVIKSGASGFLNKIAVGEEMISVVCQLLSGRKYFSQAVIELLALHVGAESSKKTHELLSNREFDVMRGLASGKPVGKIAEALSLSSVTVSTYRARIMKKIGIKTNTELIRYAIENNLVS